MTIEERIRERLRILRRSLPSVHMSAAEIEARIDELQRLLIQRNK